MAAADKPFWAMGGITDDTVEQYIYNLLPARDEVLSEMEKEAAQRDVPIVGPAVGRLFYLLARISGVKTVFEMGSAIGYSTVWWARGVGEMGHVTYTDGDAKNTQKARDYLQRAGVAGRVTFRTGDALEILSEQKPGSLDLIFNDVDKVDYPRVLRLAVPRLRSGGLFVTDNVLWSGKVAQKNNSEPETKAILEFNRLLYDSKELFPTILPLRDGVAVALKA